jgi:hypothetical protein
MLQMSVQNESMNNVINLPTPTAPTPEMIDGRREAQEEAAQAAIDWKRYQTDQAYRERVTTSLAFS